MVLKRVCIHVTSTSKQTARRLPLTANYSNSSLKYDIIRIRMFASLVSGTIMDLYYVKFDCMMSITVNINTILVRAGTWLRSCLTVVRLPAASRPFCSINCASCNRAFVRRKSRRSVCSTSVDTSRTVNVIHQHQRIPVSLIERGLQYYEQSCISLIYQIIFEYNNIFIND